MNHDNAFEMAVSAVRFGPGVTREVGFDLAELGARHVLVVTDPVVAALPPVAAVRESLDANRVRYTVYEGVRVEPTDESFLAAIAFANDGDYDAIVAVGGGSAIDTAKAVNLYTTYPPDDFLDYVNPPIGKGPADSRPAQAADRHSDDSRHRQRNDRRQHLRLHAAPREDRHRQPPPQADPRPARSGQHADHATRGGSVERPRHPEPRDRIVHRDAVHRPAPPGSPGTPPGVPGLEPDQRRLVAAGAAHGGRLHRPRVSRSVGRRGAGADDAGRVVCRRRLRERRRPSAARDVVSGVGEREDLSTRRATRPRIRWCRTACRSFSTRPRCFASPQAPVPSGI